MEITDLEKLKITDDLRAVMARYVRYADNKDWVSLAGSFTPTGVFTPLNEEGVAIRVMTGREDISAKLLKSVGRAKAIHHLFSFEIEVESDTRAKGIFAMEDYLIRPEDEKLVAQQGSAMPPFRRMHGFGHYHADFIKTDGEWFISNLKQTRIKLEFTY
ncbi:nuclear transport factor 2 family protein [Mucilaginibacter sp. BJC16-A38]|uniref:nuclear transport factor 2 family protein n=1 Tax=Mucilaginibacter phenanthrenivorans TaxID=1234842 RepID=UPI0021571EFB|nr:nuclear transport factor 2 family protein [Mucilaginibacter phenanthrenivorans]MCR8557316.1 nuclear transport factor 2 family protein [Mucilaginibacter phenanthrenivorans]